jgi:hypothetical protein
MHFKLIAGDLEQQKTHNDNILDDSDSEDEEGPHCCLSLKEMVCNCERCKAMVRDCCTVEAVKKKFPIIKWLPKYRYMYDREK